jgi:hypothetical protein
MNISVNSKPNSKIFKSVNQGPIWGQFMKITEVKKSRATVPLNKERREDDLVGEKSGGGEKYKK